MMSSTPIATYEFSTPITTMVVPIATVVMPVAIVVMPIATIFLKQSLN
jgi:hypothetical protein